jgi:hypothetical protein
MSVGANLLAYVETSSLAIAGALGGIVRWVTLRPDWREGVGAIIVGGICAQYLGPLIPLFLMQVFGAAAVQNLSADPALYGFLVGLFGISMTGWLLERMFPPRRKDNADAGQ